MEKFEEFLAAKKINSEAFQKMEPQLWEELRSLFDQMHPDSFTAQKLYLINPLRLKYPGKKVDSAGDKPKAARPRPKIPRTKPPE